MKFSSSQHKGFTLVELSIVLVILGLLVGGVLSGQSLVRAAELRSISSDLQRYSAATYSFLDKYSALPGDMPNATKFWGVVSGSTGTDAACIDTPSTNKNTCNGNGNGRIALDTSTWNNDAYERFRYWQHLANAGLIEGTYTGVHGSGSIFKHVPGVNAPSSKISGANWTASGSGPHVGVASVFDGPYGNGLELRTDGASNYAFLKPEETWNIDTKIDDGRPGLGKFLVYTAQIAAFENCTVKDTGDFKPTHADGAIANYKLSYANKACSIIYVIGL